MTYFAPLHDSTFADFNNNINIDIDPSLVLLSIGSKPNAVVSSTTTDDGLMYVRASTLEATEWLHRAVGG